MTCLRHVAAVVALAWSVAALLAPAAQATFPGQNGKFVFGGDGIHTINPDGTGLTEVVAVNGVAAEARWSPDGTRIAFSSNHDDPGCAPTTCNYDIYVVDQDGSDLTRLTTDPGRDTNPMWSLDGTEIRFLSNRATNPDIFRVDSTGGNEALVANTGHHEQQITWSPDGQEMAFSATVGGADPEIYVMDADGTDVVQLISNSQDDYEPSWSPDSQRITWWNEDVPCGICGDPFRADIWTMGRNGSSQTQLTAHDTYNWRPVWSPDGSKIAFTRADGPQPGLHVMNPDGTGVTFVASIGGVSDWQPLPYPGYARPKGATPLFTYLVPAYDACAAPNREHGPPLAFPSCSPPQPTSDWLTVGTADSNDQPTKSIGSLSLHTKPGNPATPADEADIRVEVLIRDVRNQSDLSDYGGELEARAQVRLTDKNNDPAPGGGSDPGTMTDVDPFPLATPVVCTPTADPTIGAACNLTTTMDAQIPGAVKEGKRAIWEVGQVQVIDGGADGLLGTSGNTLFLKQGVFVP